MIKVSSIDEPLLMYRQIGRCEAIEADSVDAPKIGRRLVDPLLILFLLSVGKFHHHGRRTALRFIKKKDNPRKIEVKAMIFLNARRVSSRGGWDRTTDVSRHDLRYTPPWSVSDAWP